MSITEQNINKEGSRNRLPFIIAAVTAVLLIAGLIYYQRNRPAATPYAGPPQQRLEGALRAGSPEFEQAMKLMAVDGIEADEGSRVVGDIVMTLRATVRNFTGRVIGGLEMRAAVVDLEGKPIKERYVIVVPNAAKSITELENNRTLPVSVTIEGFSKSDVRANIQMEVTGIKFR
ncbi:MAG TPA: hypothetical protein VF658_15445 [Pyrinomonadaceae bacterium]|jgi:hypothetical protein